MSQGFLPGPEAEMLAWSTTFDGHITASPEIYGLNAIQASDYNALHQEFAGKYWLSKDDNTRTPSVIQAKRDALKALRAYARKLAKIVQAFPETTNVMRVDLGLTVPDVEPTPVPPPAEPPEIDIMAVMGRTVRLRLHNDTILQRKRPEGVTGAAVFSYVGVEPPDELSEWKFELNTSKTMVEVVFPAIVPAGSKVWVTAFWFNRKMESGPASEPNSTHIAGGLQEAA